MRTGKPFPEPKQPDAAAVAYDEVFAKVTSFEQQMQSLQQRGFQRPWRAYNPPKNMENIFVKTCEEVLGNEKDLPNFSKVYLDDAEQKVALLGRLTTAFGGHRIPNSMLHTMTTLDKVFTFYSAEVTNQSPYDKLEDGVRHGRLPQNLSIQKEPLRFDPENATSDLGRVTAFPRSSTILVSPEARKKWKPLKAKHDPWQNSEYGDKELE